MGRTLGYPTANLMINDPEKLIPGNGVYAVIAQLKNVEVETSMGNSHPENYKGMMNIGVRPTIDGTTRVIEVNIFDFNDDIYEQTLKVHLKTYLRTEQKFNGMDALKEQLGKDKLDALKVLS